MPSYKCLYCSKKPSNTILNTPRTIYFPYPPLVQLILNKHIQHQQVCTELHGDSRTHNEVPYSRLGSFRSVHLQDCVHLRVLLNQSVDTDEESFLRVELHHYIVLMGVWSLTELNSEGADVSIFSYSHLKKKNNNR